MPEAVEQELNASVAYSPIQRMRHSAAHVMAEAVQSIFPDAKFAIGPAIEDGFYYDMELPARFRPMIFQRSSGAWPKASLKIIPLCKANGRAKKRSNTSKNTTSPTRLRLLRICPMLRWASTSRGHFWTFAGGRMWKARGRSALSS